MILVCVEFIKSNHCPERFVLRQDINTRKLWGHEKEKGGPHPGISWHQKKQEFQHNWELFRAFLLLS